LTLTTGIAKFPIGTNRRHCPARVSAAPGDY
jgi:hypothetical protein